MSTQAESKNEVQERQMVLRSLLREGSASTQDELCEALNNKGFDCTQSTISRDLRRVGAIKTTNAEGEIVYKLNEVYSLLPPQVSSSLDGLLTEIHANESMVVLHTTPGSASLVARHIDNVRSSIGILGTIAGDDTIFVVPASVKKISSVIRKIKEELY
jgi:transcriptional regulator of arginine metabolism